jgi:UDP-hydrolysing UDP-N-acetyl-D-glucosamine 2-epimerase
MTQRRTVAIITGTRAEFGLLRSVMRSVHQHADLRLEVLAAGAHLIAPAVTISEIRREFSVAATVPMQVEKVVGRIEDARALGRGVSGFADAFAALQPDWVLVLGDRIEAFAAAAAASVGGWAVAHVHGGDRAEGVADEAMRHAITKLAHLHLPATTESAERIIRMGESAERVHVVGSPAIDEIASMPPMSESDYDAIGQPDAVLLLHPIGRSDAEEAADARAVLDGVFSGGVRRLLWLVPNLDPGRTGIMDALSAAEFEQIRIHKGVRTAGRLMSESHMERRKFVGLLRRVQLLIGNSSAGLIEAPALGCSVVNVGPRQGGRSRPPNVVDVEEPDALSVAEAVRRACRLKGPFAHPYGDGRAGPRIAALLAKTDPHDPALLRKRNSY